MGNARDRIESIFAYILCFIFANGHIILKIILLHQFSITDSSEKSMRINEAIHRRQMKNIHTWK